MIHIIIFSFNRALQLDALLSSIQKYWINISHHVTILYNTTDNSYQKGYNILKQKYPTYSFTKETIGNYKYPIKNYISFFNLKKLIRYKKCRVQKSNFRELLNQIIAQSNDDYIMFLTDDSIFINKVNIDNKLLLWISSSPQNNSFSLRLGRHINTPSKPLKIDEDIINWKYSDYKSFKNWGYPFSVDGHIYSKIIIKQLLNKIIFNNPSTLEAHVYDYVQKHGLLNIGKTSVSPFLLSYPLNMVQTMVDNESLNISPNKLNNYLLQGYNLYYPIPEEITTFQQYPNEVYLKKNTDTITLKASL